uniref:Uncharacterized protein n=1 Tax=Physcomitrium patens TaxID=3218 RepID=A0A2K1KNG2_PHYPA|nr:hypothetical protein PHYPA_006216 [Physcomitrium patens]
MQWNTLASSIACGNKFLALKPKKLSLKVVESLPLAILTTKGLWKV